MRAVSRCVSVCSLVFLLLDSDEFVGSLWVSGLPWIPTSLWVVCGCLDSWIPMSLWVSGLLRPGRPTDASWVRHPKVPMSDATRQRLDLLAEQFSTEGRKVSPMQIAAQIIEDALTGIPDR